MSTDSPASSSSFYNNNDDDDGLNFKTALVVVGAVLGFIVFLLVLRFGCNVAIDLCILCDLREARRTLSDLRDSFCFWRRRGVVAPETTTSGELVLVEQQQQQGGEEQSEQAAVERLLQGLSDTERSIVISTLLKGMPVEKQDLHQWKQRYNNEQQLHQHHPTKDTTTTIGNSVSSDQHSKVSVLSLGDSISSDQEQQGVSCSICLHDLQEGNTVFVEPNCQHVFHRDCIVEWCSSGPRIKTSCPYCRQSMLTQEQLQSVLETRRRQHNDSNNNHDHHEADEEA